MISPSEIELGIAMPFWKEIEKKLKEWLNDIHIELEDMDQGNDLGVFKRLSGNAETVRRVLALPEYLKDEYEYELENRKGDNYDTDRRSTEGD